MNIFTDNIIEIIKYCKNLNPEKFTPIRLDISAVYETDLMKELVNLISNDEKGIIEQARSILEEERLNDIEHSFNFTLKTCIANNKDITVINDILRKTEGFELDEIEVKYAFTNSRNLIKRKVDYKSDVAIEKLLNYRISNFDYYLNCNRIYISNKKSFVLAVIIISYHLKRFNNPIDELAYYYNLLNDFYKSKNIDLMADIQFSKYGLLSLNGNFTLGNEFPSRVYDLNIKATVFLNGLEDYTFNYIAKLYKNFTFNLSVKPSPIFFLDKIYTIVKLDEHLEVGSCFDIDSFDNNCISKLYDDDYNVFWVKIDSQNITFEEIVQDFDVINDSIITQVIHCEYIQENEGLFITHLDHEFIYYSMEEYENRKNNAHQKGSDRPRVKTFKIDKAKIPINHEDNCLFTILNMKFKCRGLLKEYFSKINKN